MGPKKPANFPRISCKGSRKVHRRAPAGAQGEQKQRSKLRRMSDTPATITGNIGQTPHLCRHTPPTCVPVLSLKWASFALPLSDLTFSHSLIQLSCVVCIVVCLLLRWAKSRDSYRRIASESHRCDSNR